MTTERVVYLAGGSKREKWIRDNIAYYKQQLKIYKRAKLTNDGGEIWLRKQIRNTKRYLTTYRHELHRLKGMNRVVVPKRRIVFASPTENFNVGDTLGRCKCGQVLDSALMKFCPNCGRKILWEKVK